MEYTIEDFKKAIDSINAQPHNPDPTICPECKMTSLLMTDPLLDEMFKKMFYQIVVNPKDIIAYAVAMVQVGASLREAQIMKEMFV